MSLEGELVVNLGFDGRSIRKATVRSTRPFAAARVLTGKSSSDAAATVPLLYSICRRAQEAAAASALAAAAGTDADRDHADHELEVVLETVQENFRCLLIDWPHAMGRPPVAMPVAAARNQISAALRGPRRIAAKDDIAGFHELAAALCAGAARDIYGVPLADWLAHDDADALQAWIARGTTLPARLLDELVREMPRIGCSDVGLMPPATPDALAAVVMPAMARTVEFERAPTWNGTPVETGALARMRACPPVVAFEERFGYAIATRMVARLAELATLLLRLADDAPAPPRIQGMTLAPGEGVAAVETARGLLLHRARLVDGRVADYRIVAPTEWNFHPDGALARGLRGLRANDAATIERQARLAVQALDPCVAFRIEVGHA